MNLEQIRENMTEIKTEIGTVRTSRNKNAFRTGCWTLCGTLNGVRMVGEPTTMTGVLVGLTILCAGFYGLQWYLKQNQLNELREEQQELQLEEAGQLKLKRQSRKI